MHKVAQANLDGGTLSTLFRRSEQLIRSQVGTPTYAACSALLPTILTTSAMISVSWKSFGV